jgi:hypothetical protein
MPRSIAPPAGAALTATVLILHVGVARGDVATLAPSTDNTLFQPVNDPTSSGSGPDLYVGRTAFNGSRRAVLRFDLSSIPASATINAVTLNVRVTRVPQGGHAEDVSLHRLSADWGEGASAADGGDGDPPQAGDATWVHRFFRTTLWSNPGGDFDAGVSATRHLSGLGAYSFSSAAMVSDVQSWLTTPASNFGWIMIGDETITQTSRRLGSRENPDPSLRPQLLVTYTPVPEPSFLALPTLSVPLLKRRQRRNPEP